MKEERLEKEYELLTHAQRRIWYNESLYPNTSINIIGGYVRIYGQINLEVLDRAIQRMIKSNDGFQIRLIKGNEDIKQYFEQYRYKKTKLLDFSSRENPEKEFLDWCQKFAATPFEMLESPLYEFVRFKLASSDMGYYIKLNHIIGDGWTIKIIIEQVYKNYMDILNGIYTEVEYPSYRLYMEEEKLFLQGEKAEKNRCFWIDKLKNISIEPDAINSLQIEGKRKVFHLTAEETNDINQYTEKHKVTLNVLFLSLFLVFLSKYFKKQTIILGIPSYNRVGAKNKQIVGMFVNPLAEPFELDQEDNFLTCLKKVEKTMKECLYNQKYPYDQIISSLNGQNASNTELYNVCFNYYNTKHITDWNGIQTENVEVYNGTQAYNLQLIVRDWSSTNNIELDIDYKVSCYQEEEIEQMFLILRYLMHQVLDNPEVPIGQYELLDDTMKQELIYGFNQKEWVNHTCSVVDLFEQQSIKSPTKEACEFDGQLLTYQELNDKVNQMSRYLMKLGVKRGDRVALMTKYSFETIIGIFAILKSGACYVPIIPDLTVERIRYILNDSNIKILVTNLDELPELQFQGKVVSLKEEAIWLEFKENPPKNHDLTDLCYIIYTSGSTGKPKGTLIEHKGLVNYITWAVKMYIEEEEVFPVFTSLGFDLTVTSIFTPLVSGNKIAIYPFDKDEYPIERILRENKATIIKLTPSQLVLLSELNMNNTSLKKIIVGGEDLKVKQAKDTVQAFDSRIRIFNEYGPTETVVGSMIYEYNQVRDKEGSVPIGKAIANTCIYLLDQDCNPVPLGHIGELYISGDGVARGYLNNPEQTEKAFLDNPFLRGKRMYKTGDLAIFQGKNNLVYVGRMDGQIKIRGHRVELQEIENCLLQHESVSRVAVIAQEMEKDKIVLSAFLEVTDEIEEEKLRTYMQERLPSYMIPVYMIFIDDMPLTQNGKVDVAKLTRYQKRQPEKKKKVVSNSEHNKVLIEAIKELMHRDDITVADNFFYLGGDSIKAIQLSNRMKNKGYQLSVKSIMKYPELAQMAIYIYEDKKSVFTKQDLHDIKNTPVVNWYFREINQAGFVQALVLDIEDSVSFEQVSWCLKKIRFLHPALCIAVRDENEKLFWKEDLQEKAIPVYETMQVEDEVYEQLKEKINLSDGGLFQAAFIRTGEERNKVMLVCNHLVIDVVSWIIILEDLDYLLTVDTTADLSMRSEKTSYAFWTNKMYNYGAIVQDTSINYWEQQVKQIEQLNMWKRFKETEEDTMYKFFNIVYSAEVMQQISEKLFMYYHINANIFFTFLVSFIWFKCQDNTTVAFTIEHNGRNQLDDSDVSNTVGWFTQIYPLILSCESFVSIDGMLKDFRERIMKAEKLAEDYNALLMRGRVSEAQWNQTVWLNFLGDMEHLIDNKQFFIADDMSHFYRTEDNCMTHPLEIIGWYQKNEFQMSIHYQIGKFPTDFQEKLEDAFKQTVQELINYTGQLNKVQFTPSDFELAQLSQNEIDNLFE